MVEQYAMMPVEDGPTALKSGIAVMISLSNILFYSILFAKMDVGRDGININLYYVLFSLLLV